MNSVFRKLPWLINRSEKEAELQAELQFHLDEDAEERQSDGLTPEEGRYAALRAFGNIGLIKEDTRAVWIPVWLQQVVQDTRYALRQLHQHPAFAAMAIVTLALGFGVNTAIFTVTNAVLFKGFRLVERNDRILYIHSEKNGQWSGVSYPDFEDWRAQARSFRGLGAVGDLKILCDRGEFRGVCFATRITANGFGLLGQKPILGRDFAPSDETPGAAPVAILSYGFWEHQFGKDPAVVGRVLHLGIVDQTLQVGDAPPTTIAAGTPPTTVIGVMPKGFAFPQDQDFWVPLALTTPDVQRRDARNLWFAFGRMRDGATRKSARAELETIGRQLANSYPQTNQNTVPQLQSFTEFFMGPNATLIYLAMWGAVGFVLLIACANVANLLLARATGRSREMSVRMALGAGRWRIVRQLFIESLVLSTIGSAAGWAIARLGVRTYELVTNPPVGGWNRDLLDYAMDSGVLAYLLAISISAALLFGLAPALWLSRDLHTLMKDGGLGTTSGKRRRRASGLLVMGEVALAVVLLAGAGVMIHSFLNMYTADIGARTTNTVEMLLRLPTAKYPRREAQVSFYDRLKTRLEAIPGVEFASIGLPPASGTPGRRPYELAGGCPIDERSRPTIAAMTIGPDYFRALGATVLFGRDFDNSDNASGLPVVLVNQRFAGQHWPGANALGQRLRLFNGEAPEAWLTIVGVMSNVVYDPRRQEIAPLVYLPYAQRSRADDPWVLVRTAVPGGGLIRTLRREVSALDPDVIMWLGPYDLADRLASVGVYGSTRNNTVLLLIFALIALLLASIGLYTVTAHSVSWRTREIGIRMAMGATARDTLKLVLAQGMVPVGIGLIIGLAAAFAVTPILKSALVNVSPADPLMFVLATLVLLLAALLGCLIPARRAIRIDPAVTLRHE